MKSQFNRLTLALAGAAIFTMAGCGGGGGGTDSAPTPTPVANALTLTGSAATGAAISAAPVAVKCATGTGSATTNADGSYTLSVNGGALPCLAKVTLADSTVLHSVVAGTGSSATINITPATQLIVASLGGRDPAAYFTAFDATVAAALTSAQVAAAQTAVVAKLKAAGVDMSALGDLISGSLKPASGTTAGNAYDVALDALKTALATGGITLADLVKDVIAKSPNVPSTTPGAPAIDPAGVASLPDDLALKAQASTCSALRSTTYRVIAPTPGAPLANQFGSFTFNASTLTGTDSGGGTFTWTAVPNSPCRFTGFAGTEFVVSQAGLIVARGTTDNGVTYRPIVAFPMQSHTLAEMVGTWNSMGMQPHATSAGVYTPKTINLTVDSAGGLSAVTRCANDATWSVAGADCKTETSSLKFAINADGGFDLPDVNTNIVNNRSFVYKAGGGELMAINVGGGNGGFNILTKQRTSTLPPVGRVTKNVGPSIGSALTIGSAFGPGSQQTIVSQNTVAGSIVRTAKLIGGTNDHPQTVTINSPRNGYNFRTPATAVPAIDGTLQNVLEFTSMPLRGMGMVPLVLPAINILLLSVDLP
jgi:hypothetical protein